MKDFPKPLCPALQTPKIDDDIKKQIKQASKDPHFRVEKSLYKLQEQILDMAGPLTCLWADLLNQYVTVKPEDVILLLQKVLVLLESAFHNVSQERRRIAWSQTNPATNTLPDISEETKGKKTTLFGAGFLERATKRLEEEKVLAKVTRTKDNHQQNAVGKTRIHWTFAIFGEWRPCKVRQQEPSMPTDALPETNIQIPKEGQKKRTQVEDKKQLSCAHMINL